MLKFIAHDVFPDLPFFGSPPPNSSPLPLAHKPVQTPKLTLNIKDPIDPFEQQVLSCFHSHLVKGNFSLKQKIGTLLDDFTSILYPDHIGSHSTKLKGKIRSILSSHDILVVWSKNGYLILHYIQLS